MLKALRFFLGGHIIDQKRKTERRERRERRDGAEARGNEEREKREHRDKRDKWELRLQFEEEEGGTSTLASACCSASLRHCITPEFPTIFCSKTPVKY